MDFIKKPLIYSLSIVLLFIALGFGVFYLYNKFDSRGDKLDITGSDYQVEFIYNNGKDEYKVVNIDESRKRWLLINNNPDKVLLSVPTSPAPILELPEVNTSKDILSSLDSEDGFSYEMSLEDTANYINFLKQKGYTQEYQVNASNYIEVVLKSDKERLRLIAQRNLLIIGQVSPETKLPKIEKYLETYSKAGGTKK